MSKTTLYIANKNYSSWSLRGWLAVRFVGLAFEEVIIRLRKDTTEQEISKISASKKVPCLHHEGLIIWDSLAIAEYLNETFPEKKLFPRDKKKRALARSICAEMHSSFLNVRSEMPMNMKKRSVKEQTPAVQKEIARILEIWQNCLKEYNGKYLLGEFSIADIFYAPIVSRFISYSVDTSTVQAYVKNISNHPLYKEWENEALKEADISA